MKIAIVTDDGKRISKHFGRGAYYSVYTIEDGKIVSTELRERHFGHHSQQNHTHHEHKEGEHHGMGQDEKHDLMAREISDCQVLIAGGMGGGAYNRMFENGINVIMTDENDVQNAVNRYLNNDLQNLYEQLTH